MTTRPTSSNSACMVEISLKSDTAAVARRASIADFENYFRNQKFTSFVPVIDTANSFPMYFTCNEADRLALSSNLKNSITIKGI